MEIPNPLPCPKCAQPTVYREVEKCFVCVPCRVVLTKMQVLRAGGGDYERIKQLMTLDRAVDAMENEFFNRLLDEEQARQVRVSPDLSVVEIRQLPSLTPEQFKATARQIAGIIDERRRKMDREMEKMNHIMLCVSGGGTREEAEADFERIWAAHEQATAAVDAPIVVNG